MFGMFVMITGFFPAGVTGLKAQVQASSVPGPTNLVKRVVGELGDTARLDFEGLHTFSADAVRIGLLQNMDFLLASHPEAPLDDFLKELQILMESGYRNKGFPDARASVTDDSPSGRILVKVNEGRRCLQAGIKVTQAGTIPVQALIQRLRELPPSANPAEQSVSERLRALQQTQQTMPNGISTTTNNSSSPVWETGKRASFSVRSLNSLIQSVDDALRELGCFFVRTRVRIVPDRQIGAADLLIEVLDPGSSGVIDQINITGLKRNQREVVLEYLGLKSGLPVNRQLLKRIEDLLWRSARFLAFEVTPETTPDRKHINLRISLTEFEPMPPLHQELSREASALLRFRDWLSNQESPGRDLVFSLGSIEKPLTPTGLGLLQVVLSRRGVILTSSDGAVNAKPSLLYAAVMTPETIGLYHLAHHSKLAFAVKNLPLKLKVSLSVLANPDPAAKDNFFFSLGGGIDSLDDDTTRTEAPDDPHVRIDWLLAPVAFAAQAYSHDQSIRMSFAGGLMTYSSDRFRIKIEEKSGKLVEFNLITDGKIVTQIASDNQAFDKTLAQINGVSAADRNQADSSRPINSILAFSIKESLQTERVGRLFAPNLPTEQRHRGVVALETILDQSPFAPLDAMVARKLSPKGEESFWIPMAPGSTPQTASMSFFAPMVFRYGNELFPQGSWPCLILREAVLYVGNHGKYSSQVLQHLFESDQTGSLGFEAIARLLDLANSPLKVPFANRGLTRLTAVDFRKDCRLLLDEDSALLECCSNVTHGLARLDDEQTEALASLLSPDDAAVLRRSIELLRKFPGKPLAESLQPALDAIWHKHLQRMVETDLRKTAGTSFTSPIGRGGLKPSP